MADTEKGGLSSIDPTISFAQRLQTQTLEGQQILDAHRKRLMELMSSRKQMPFDPSMMALAAGLLSPTKTGGFGESLGQGMSNYAAEAERQFRREQEEAKLGYELEVGAQQQKRELMGQQLMAEMFGADDTKAPAPAAAPITQVAKAEAAPAAPPAAKVEAAPTEAAPTEVASAENVQAQKVEAAQALDMPELALPAVPRNKIARMTDEQIAMLKSFNPSMGKILEEYRRAFRENRQLQISEVNLGRQLQELELSKRKDIREEKESKFKEREVKVKEASIPKYLPGVGEVKMPKRFWDALDKAKSFDDLQAVYKEFNMPLNTTVGTDGQLRFMSPGEVELKNKKAEARFTQTPIKRQIPEYGPGTFDITPVDFADYQEAKGRGPDALQHWFNGSQFSGTRIPNARIGTSINTAPSTRVDQQSSTGRVQSAEELEVETTARKKRVEEEVKADVEFGNNIMKEGTNAQNIRIIAKDLKSIASSNPKILDVMQDTTVSDALARTIQTGVITPYGSISIDPKDLYIAVDNYAKGKAGVTKADRDAYSLFLRNIAQLTILERRMSRGEGAISDRETALFQQVNVLQSDSALAVRLKAELIEERANVTERVGDAFYKYKKKTGRSYEDFTHSDEFKSIKNNYESRLDRIRDATAKLLGGVSAPSSQAAPQTELPAAAREQLVEDEVTKFNNGQEWTLRNGKAVRLK
jgi:hypothetical protein